jgi:hypothetical protein
MPDARIVYPVSEYSEIFRRLDVFAFHHGAEAQSPEYPNLNIRYTNLAGTAEYEAQNISIMEWDRINEELTFAYDIADGDFNQITLGLEDILEVSTLEPTLSLVLDAFSEFPADITVSFDYVTARGTQKRVTGLTPAFVRPSETHAGKSILAGFMEQEVGAFTRKTFRTDRITNLVRDSA